MLYSITNFFLFQRTPRIDFSWNPYAEEYFEFYDRRVITQINKGNADFADFFRLLALCHTVMPEDKDGKYPRGSLLTQRSYIPYLLEKLGHLDFLPYLS